MPVPDFNRSRRELRQARVQEAIGLPSRGTVVRRHRDRLLEPLVHAADTPVAEFDTLAPTVVDTVVSLAISDVEESAEDALGVALLCIQVLAADGQFARLNLLAQRLTGLAPRFEVARPYIAAASEAFAMALVGDAEAADARLEAALGPTENASPTEANREIYNDLLMVASLQQALREGGRAFVERARVAAIQRQDGLVLSFVDAVLAWMISLSRATPESVVPEADGTFERPALRAYLAERGVRALFPSQIMAIQGGATLDQDTVVALPTSSGKTLVAELRIAASLSRHPGTRALYVSPYRLLARQVETSLGRGLSLLGWIVKDLGSGYNPEIAHYDALALPDVAICTPERLDALLRAATHTDPAGQQARVLFESAALLVFDELQLLGRQGRGPRFELVLARIRVRYPHMRFLGLCAANQGANDLAEWLTDAPALTGATRPTGTLEIVWETDGTLRQRVAPRPTTVAEIPRTDPRSDAAGLILRLGSRWLPVLAVETTRQQAEALAKKLVEDGMAQATTWREGLSSADAREIQVAVEEVEALLGDDHPLGRFLEYGIAFHHAGVPTHALQQVERLASMRLLRVVCSTTTVAEGADLPFRAVVIPHLNFPGPSRRLERDLYMNIIGRAGRANVSVEGIVFVLNSDAPTLRNIVQSSLWSNTTADRIQGRLSDVRSSPSSVDDWSAYCDVQSQVIGWLGDSDNYFEGQSERLAATTLSWQQGTGRDRRAIEALIAGALDDLEARGYAVAGSPYRLTARGALARMTGLAPASVARLEAALSGDFGQMLLTPGSVVMSPELAEIVARLLLESVEVVQKGLWLRRAGRTDREKFTALMRFAERDDTLRFYGTEEYRADVDLLVAWMLGGSYRDIARAAPTYSRANSLFGGTDEAKRTSDATEYIGKLTYPGSWVWSAVRILAGPNAAGLPGFIRESIEMGLPSEGATRLVRQAGVTRGAALTVTARAGDAWVDVVAWASDGMRADLPGMDVTRADRARLLGLASRLGRLG